MKEENNGFSVSVYFLFGFFVREGLVYNFFFFDWSFIFYLVFCKFFLKGEFIGVNIWIGFGNFCGVEYWFWLGDW